MQRPREGTAREITRQPHTPGGDYFVVYKMQSDDLRPVGILKVTTNRIAQRVT